MQYVLYFDYVISCFTYIYIYYMYYIYIYIISFVSVQSGSHDAASAGPHLALSWDAEPGARRQPFDNHEKPFE
jgi:hypothetical protein